MIALTRWMPESFWLNAEPLLAVKETVSPLEPPGCSAAVSRFPTTVMLLVAEPTEPVPVIHFRSREVGKRGTGTTEGEALRRGRRPPPSCS